MGPHSYIRAFLELQQAGATLCCRAWASHCSAFPCCRAGAPEHVGSVVVAYGIRYSAACGIFLNQGSNLCLLLHQADSSSLSYQESPVEHSF